MSTHPYVEYRFGPSEQPVLPGGPFSPAHHPLRRVAYLLSAITIGICSQLGNALVTVNLANIAGSLEVNLSDAAWLSAMFVAVNASLNLLLVRARIQFGIPRATHALLLLHVIATIVQLTWPGFATALLVRAASGCVATALTTLIIFNLLQVVPPKARPLAVLVAISIPQLATPIARLVPVTALTVGHWQGLHLIELGITLTAMASLMLVRLPPSVKQKAFEPLDFLTFGLVFPGMILLCGAISAGRYLWWTDTPWIGEALAVALLLFTAALLVEHNRARPLLLTDWIGSAEILHFGAVALLVRFALAEQTYGAIGLLTAGGLNNDQLHTLFLIVLVANIAGIVTAVLTLKPERIPFQVMVAAIIIGIGALLDADATNLTRPMQLYWSQALIGFGACLFIGPALLFGFGKVLQLGPNYLVSFLIIFAGSQNLGGILGASLLGTYQVVRAKAHAQTLSEHLVAGDPQVAARLAQQGSSGLYAALQREANVLAFNDVFRLIAFMAFATALYILVLVLLRWRRDRLKAAKEAQA
ncbi:MAG: MFS transporter [Novosphingobium sp.]|nr:MFS transporter [Novosphingobium sp.]